MLALPQPGLNSGRPRAERNLGLPKYVTIEDDEMTIVRVRKPGFAKKQFSNKKLSLEQKIQRAVAYLETLSLCTPEAPEAPEASEASEVALVSVCPESPGLLENQNNQLTTLTIQDFLEILGLQENPEPQERV